MGFKPDEMSMEKFEELAMDLNPVIKSMEAVLNKYGIKGIVSLRMSADDGYFSFNMHCSEWEYSKSGAEAPAIISLRIIKEV